MGGRDSVKMTAWIKPKMAHKQMVSRLLQVKAHVILCFRAEEKVEIIDDPDKPGKKKIVPKRSLTGADGWVPVSEKTLPFELTLSVLMTADRPGVPRPIKLQEQHRPMVALDSPVTEETGVRLAAWAAGAGTPVGAAAGAPSGVVAPVLATEDQRRAIAAAAGEAGLSTAQAKAVVLEVTGQEKTAGIPADRVDDVLAAIAFVTRVPA